MNHTHSYLHFLGGISKYFEVLYISTFILHLSSLFYQGMHEDLLSQGETNECEQQIAKVGRVELIGLSCQALEDIFVLQQTIEKDLYMICCKDICLKSQD